MSVVNLRDYSRFIVTGKLYGTGKKFRITSENGRHAMGINLWNGRVWGVHALTGRRRLLKRVTN